MKNEKIKLNKIGTLYVVATPIGNLQDMSLRAIEILRSVDRVAAEDTRHSALLLKHFSIDSPIISLHEFNERDRIDFLLELLQKGESIALISDAGTPLISDPGFHLVKEMKANGIPVVPIPGACAAIAALSVAGLPTDKFIFEGFLPVKQVARKHYLNLLLYETRTLIFYEAPHRLLVTLEAMMDVFGGTRKAVVARELTKLYETVLAMNLEELVDYFNAHADEIRGESVILIEGSPVKKETHSPLIIEQVLDILLKELPLKQAVSLASDITGERKNFLYEMALAKKHIK